MMKICRFCQQKSVILLFPANNQRQTKKPDLFACTNCGYGIHGPMMKCQDCGIIYVDETISQSKISQYYQFSEDPLYLQEQKAREVTFKNYLSKLEKYYPHKGKLLDVGTNTGLFVRVARNNGWDAVGLEPNSQAVDYARRHFNIELIKKPFENNTFKDNTFDVITMWDVIEHFTDPFMEMKKVYRSLRPEGMFAFSTVDPGSIVAKIQGGSWAWFMAMHRVLLSRSTACRYLKEAGFSRVVFKSHWRFFSLGYTAKLWGSVHPLFANFFRTLGEKLHLLRVIVPYYANDLYDCYAFK